MTVRGAAMADHRARRVVIGRAALNGIAVAVEGRTTVEAALEAAGADAEARRLNIQAAVTQANADVPDADAKLSGSERSEASDQGDGEEGVGGFHG